MNHYLISLVIILGVVISIGYNPHYDEVSYVLIPAFLLTMFGFIYKRTCILVDRNDPKSRRNVYESAQQKIKQGYSICIFPEGGVPLDESIVLDSFKNGAFRLAIEHHIPIVPMTFHDNKKRFSYTFFSGGPGKIRATIHAPIITTNYSLEMKKELKTKTRTIILNELNNPSL